MENYRTIGEVSEQLNIKPHVLRFWESKFKQIKPVKRRGGRRFYSESDVELIENIHILLHVKGFTIKGAQKELTRSNQKFFIQLSNDKKPEKPTKTDVDTKKIHGIVAKLRNAEKLLKGI
jgi:DNA-binding transcriptional MerR regulator